MLSFITPRLTTKLPTRGVLGSRPPGPPVPPARSWAASRRGFVTLGGREDSVDEETTVETIIDLDDTTLHFGETAPKIRNENNPVS